MSDNDMRVWVGCLACYNNGNLRGEWVDAAEAGDYVPCPIPSHEERWVFDTDTPWIAGECSPMEAQRIAEHVTELDIPGIVGDDAEAIAAVGEWLRDTYNNPTDCDPDTIADAWAGVWPTWKDYAYEMATECVGGLSGDSLLARYFDWDAWARDFAYDYTTYTTASGSVAVFRDN